MDSDEPTNPLKPSSITAPGLRQVAERAGVGVASASRVLTGRAGTSRKMRERVLAAAEELGYSPNMLARSLRSRASMTVGFVASDIANPLVAGIFRGADAVLARPGYSMLLTDSDGEPSADGARLVLLKQRQVDGNIILPVTEADPALLAAIRAATTPLVVVDRELPGDIQADYVLSDHRAGVMAATRHLLAQGHRRLAFVAGRDVRPARERVMAIREAASGIDHALTIMPGTLTEAHGMAALAAVLAQPQPPTAVILGGNQLLVGALRYIRSRELLLGRDLSLVTCDDIHLRELNSPAVATVARDIKLIGRTAAELLLRRIANPEAAPMSRELPTWFIDGGSCGRPSGT